MHCEKIVPITAVLVTVICTDQGQQWVRYNRVVQILASEESVFDDIPSHDAVLVKHIQMTSDPVEIVDTVLNKTITSASD